MGVAVYDRWHKTHPSTGDDPCEHDRYPTSRHGVGRRWQVRWRDANGVQLKRSFDHRVDADSFHQHLRRHAGPATRFTAEIRHAIRSANRAGLRRDQLLQLIGNAIEESR